MTKLLIVLCLLLTSTAYAANPSCAQYTDKRVRAACDQVYNDTLRHVSTSFQSPDKSTKAFIATSTQLGFHAGMTDALPLLDFMHLNAKYCWAAAEVIVNQCATSEEEKEYLERKVTSLTEGICSIMAKEDIRPGTGNFEPGNGAKLLMKVFGGKPRAQVEAGVVTFVPAYLAGGLFEHTARHSVAAAWIAKVLEIKLGSDIHRCGAEGVARRVYQTFTDREHICVSQKGITPAVEILKKLKSDLAGICDEPVQKEEANEQPE